MIRLLVAALGGFLAFAATVYLTSRVEEPAFVGVAGAFLSFVGVPALLLYLLKPTGASESLRRAGQLREMPLEVVRAWQIAELEDEGLHFVLETSEGTIVFLSGQLLYEPVESGLFPSTTVVVELDGRDNELVAVRCTGRHLKCERLLPSFSAEELDADLYPGSFKEFGELPQWLLKRIGISA